MNQWIPCIVQIRRNSDGLTRNWETDFSGEYIWSEGNYSCDCNRSLFFGYAICEGWTEQPCGYDGYSVRIVAKDDGRELYRDEAW